MQDKQKGWFRPIYYASRVLAIAKQNYTITEREALGMIYALEKFRHYLLANKVILLKGEGIKSHTSANEWKIQKR